MRILCRNKRGKKWLREVHWDSWDGFQSLLSQMTGNKWYGVYVTVKMILHTEREKEREKATTTTSL